MISSVQKTDLNQVSNDVSSGYSNVAMLLVGSNPNHFIHRIFCQNFKNDLTFKKKNDK